MGNVWDLVDVTFGPNGQALYLNGHLEANNFTSIALNGDTSVPLTIGAWIDDGRSYLNGSIEEVHVSTAARSADWVTTEFNNQHSPQTFYSLTSESTLTINPGAVSLYGSQSQQFSVFVGCSSPAIWSMPADSPGTLSGDGLYTAPTIVTAQQNVTIIATSTADLAGVMRFRASDPSASASKSDTHPDCISTASVCDWNHPTIRCHIHEP